MSVNVVVMITSDVFITHFSFVGFEVLTAVALMITIFWEITSCSSLRVS
jgi:hypothetical protein